MQPLKAIKSIAKTTGSILGGFANLFTNSPVDWSFKDDEDSKDSKKKSSGEIDKRNAFLLDTIFTAMKNRDSMKLIDEENQKKLQKDFEDDENKRNEDIVKALSKLSFSNLPKLNKEEEIKNEDGEVVAKVSTKKKKPTDKKINVKTKGKATKEKPGKPEEKPSVTPQASPPKTDILPNIKPTLGNAPATAAGGTAATATKIVGGTALAVAATSVKAKISGKESAGSSDKSYNIMNIGTGEKSGRDNVFPLTDMTIPEVINLAEQRGQKFNKSGMGKAAGKYQFMPGTLERFAKIVFKEKWKETKYTPDNQELLMDALIASNADTLKQNGIPVSDVTLYAMHFTGSVNQTKMIAESPDNVSMKQILSEKAQRANPNIANMTVGQYREWLQRGGFNFQNIQIVSPTNETVTPEPPQVSTGTKMDETSKSIKNIKRDLSAKTDTPSVTTNINSSQSSTSNASKPVVDDRSEYQRKKEN